MDYFLGWIAGAILGTLLCFYYAVWVPYRRRRLYDYFAGQALAGIMANPGRWKQIAEDYQSGRKTYAQCSRANVIKAYDLADHALVVRDEKFAALQIAMAAIARSKK